MPQMKFNAIHPGEVLLEVYLKPSCPPLTVAGLSQAIQVPQRYLTDLIAGHRTITRAVAARLGVICRTTPDFWLSLQRTYDIQMGKRDRARKGFQRRGHADAA